jgi:hypothetical protein
LLGWLANGLEALPFIKGLQAIEWVI